MPRPPRGSFGEGWKERDVWRGEGRRQERLEERAVSVVLSIYLGYLGVGVEDHLGPANQGSPSSFVKRRRRGGGKNMPKLGLGYLLGKIGA
jgi:hypothetical protein